MVKIVMKQGKSHKYTTRIEPKDGNDGEIVEITRTSQSSYALDILGFAFLILGILIFLQLRRMSGTVYFISATLQVYITVLIIFLMIYVAVKIVSEVINLIYFQWTTKEDEKDVKQEL